MPQNINILLFPIFNINLLRFATIVIRCISKTKNTMHKTIKAVHKTIGSLHQTMYAMHKAMKAVHKTI